MLLSIFNSKKRDTKTELDYLLERADELSRTRNGAHALHDLQKLVLRPIQSIHMLDAYTKPWHSAIDSIDDYLNFGLNRLPTKDEGMVDYLWNTCRLPDETLPTARLGSDIVLPTCWHPSSIMDLIGRFGEHRGQMSWKQDFNHKIVWWYPLNIYWVHGGNHSIAQGILNAEGQIKPKEGYDLSSFYDVVKFDGENWIDTTSGARLGTPRYKEIGYVYEIGRYILKINGA